MTVNWWFVRYNLYWICTNIHNLSAYQTSARTLLQSWSTRLVFGRCPVRCTAGSPAILVSAWYLAVPPGMWRRYSRTYLNKFQKLEIKKTPFIPAYSWPYYTAPKHGRSWRKKKGRSKLVSGRWNGEYCKLYGATETDKHMNAEGRQRTNMLGIVAVDHSFKWKWGGHVARMDQRWWAQATSMWGIRIRQKNGATEDEMDRHAQECSSGTMVTNSEKPERVEKTHATTVKLRRHKPKVATPMYLVTQVPTYQTEVKFYCMFQTSTATSLRNSSSSDKTLRTLPGSTRRPWPHGISEAYLFIYLFIYLLRQLVQGRFRPNQFQFAMHQSYYCRRTIRRERHKNNKSNINFQNA
jgi:hypothetical protein